MASPYVYERQSEYWTSRQIEEFFLDAGFEVIAFPLSQYNERLVPADFMFFDRKRSKLFGFQYKALYRNERDFWPINYDQHQRLRNFSWIYYCLSELKTTQDYRAALHLVRIINPQKFEFQDRLYPSGRDRLEYYSRWGAFYQGLERCSNGFQVQSRAHLNSILKPEDDVELPWELSDLMADLFIADFASRHAVHLSPLLREHKQTTPDKTSMVSLGREEVVTRVENARRLGQLPDFTGCDLRGANLSNLDLQEAVMATADLSGANLQGANLTEADLRGTNLQGASLHGADLRRAVYDRTTIWPSDFDPSTAGLLPHD